MKHWVYWNVAKPLCDWCSPWDGPNSSWWTPTAKEVDRTGWIDRKEDRSFPERKSIFIALPKCGHNSIIRGLKPYCHEFIVAHGQCDWIFRSSRAHVCKLATPSEKWNSYLKFTFVRNPYSRVLAAWEEMNHNYN